MHELFEERVRIHPDAVAAVSALLGVLAAFVFPHLHRAFHMLRNPLIFTTLGGMLLGVLGIIGGPITLFKGLEQTAELLEHPGDYTPQELALFAAVKIVALLVAASAGFRGGRIFPAVFVGTAFGLLAFSLFPGIPISLAVACGVMGIVARRDERRLDRASSSASRCAVTSRCCRCCA